MTDDVSKPCQWPSQALHYEAILWPRYWILKRETIKFYSTNISLRLSNQSSGVALSLSAIPLSHLENCKYISHKLLRPLRCNVNCKFSNKLNKTHKGVKVESGAVRICFSVLETQPNTLSLAILQARSFLCSSLEFSAFSQVCNSSNFLRGISQLVLVKQPYLYLQFTGTKLEACGHTALTSAWK